MQLYDSDLHIHSKYSIAVSQSISLETMEASANLKGLNILGTGDITQPDWRNYLKENLEYENGILSYKNLHFILQTEIEDEESIHHVVLFPDFRSAEVLQEKLSPFVKNITGRWAGRPHVHKSPAEIVEMIEDVGAICGPAHAFTPFKSIFRQGKFSTLGDAYGTAAKKVSFLELGLSANTQLADRIESLREITFLSNSDAHSEATFSLGREFNRIQMENPSFDELKKALLRRKGRKIVLNVGMDPQLGKYYIMFCNKCRRRIQREMISEPKKPTETKETKILNEEKEGREAREARKGKEEKEHLLYYQDKERKKGGLDNFMNTKSTPTNGFYYTFEYDQEFVKYSFPTPQDKKRFLLFAQKKKLICPACKGDFELNSVKRKIPRLRLGVSERIDQISTWKESKHPEHRPNYINIIPLIDILRTMKGIKSKNSKTITKIYSKAIETIGLENNILVDIEPKNFSTFEEGKLSNIISAFREGKIEYIPGGGGIFGSFKFD